MAYFSRPSEKTLKYAALLARPSIVAASAMPVLIKLPTAVAITEAFQVRIKIAPTPYKKANSRENIMTCRLLSKIWTKSAFWTALPVTGEFILLIVDDWTENNCSTIEASRTMYQKAIAMTMPRKR